MGRATVAVSRLWILVAASIWTPLVVLAAMTVGRAALAPLDAWLGAWWPTRMVAAVGAVALLRLTAMVATPAGRERVSVALARVRCWGFWPAWIVNLPAAVWIAMLALRHRGLTVFTAANPAIEDGGVVGESKSAILAQLPEAWVVPWATVEPGALAARMGAVHSTLDARAWRYPLVAKPDVGERGTGVRWLHGEVEARAYLAREPRRVLLQVPHEGPFEAGIFYVRHPGAARGRIFSLTDKRFPVIVGDGRSTLCELVRAHPLDGSAASRVTLRGEIVDSKCFLGVMVPGAGRTHKECASLCVRGGIPPALFVRDRHGRSALLLLERLRGEPVALVCGRARRRARRGHRRYSAARGMADAAE